MGEAKTPQIRVSPDNMEAFLTLPVPDEGQIYSLSDVLGALQQKNVTTGIDEEQINRLIENKTYSIERRVAVGVQPTEGRDGYYEYLFPRNFSRAPRIMPDGSCDYYSVNLIATAAEGDLIAKYHPCVTGSDGYNVKGAVLTPKRVRDLPPLLGKGFIRSDAGDEYFAAISGKIEIVSDRITISPLYEISGDIGVATGDIIFNGDVIIHGMVQTGMNISATGTITIDGIVENAYINAGKDIVLKSGLMGNSEAVIKTKGNLFAKFVEYATLDIGGSINAEVLLNCDVVCGEKVIISGNLGSIVGGSIKAIGGVEANNIGNETETKCVVAVGAEVEIYRRVKILEHKIETMDKNMQLIDSQIAEIEAKEAQRSVIEKPKPNPRKVSLLRMKIKENASIQGDRLELETLTDIVSRSQYAMVVVNGMVYPGVTIKIDDLVLEVKDPHKSINFVKHGESIRMEEIIDKIEA